MAGVRDRALNPKFAKRLGSLESLLQENLLSLLYLITNKTRLTASTKISFLLHGKLCWEPKDARSVFFQEKVLINNTTGTRKDS